QVAALETLRDRIAENRIVAGLHYPLDNDAGFLLGRSIAALVLERGGVALDNLRPLPNAHAGDENRNDAGRMQLVGMATSTPVKWLLERAIAELEDDEIAEPVNGGPDPDDEARPML
ncbi:MAG: hypothetical protein MI673_00755, partial [Thiotrichales bacterium]|nr:hypothetical protein [Thiotrichales bacterium]